MNRQSPAHLRALVYNTMIFLTSTSSGYQPILIVINPSASSMNIYFGSNSVKMFLISQESNHQVRLV